MLPHNRYRRLPAPAFSAILMVGCLNAYWTMLTPFFWSSLLVGRSSNTFKHLKWQQKLGMVEWNVLPSIICFKWLNSYLNRAVPPPGTMPSSIAALVAHNASLTRSFFSFISTSEDPPILSTATPKNLNCKKYVYTAIRWV